MMEPKEFGCRPEAEKQKGDEDEESLMEECWTAKYKGDSRKWLIRDGSYKNRRGPLMSSMKASYIYPLKEDKDLENLGKRKAQLLKKFYEEASEEVRRESSAPPPVEDYCTEYDSNYQIPGFEVDDEPHTKRPELYLKYPLYGRMPTTIYSYNLQNQYPKPYIGGLTKSTDCRSPFKRSCGFTTPLSERLDEGTW